MATLTSAKRRASSMASEPFCSAICTAIWLYKPRRRAQARCPVVTPIDADLGLLRGSLRRRHRAAEIAVAGDGVISTAAVVLYLVERGRVLRGVQRRRRRNRELIGRPSGRTV